MTSFDDRPVEDDPTGMRALLAGLPDPGPMPEDLVTRITAALESEHRAGPVPRAERSPDQPLAPVVELQPRRRPTHRWLSVAAAAALVVGGGGLVLSAMKGSLTRQSATSGGGAEGMTVPGAASAYDGSAVTILVAAGTDISADAAGGSPTTASKSTAQLDSLASESPAIGPIGTPRGARDCARALGIPDTSSLVVTLLLVDGRPGATVVATSSGGERTAYAVLRSCPAQEGYRLSGPLPVP